MSQPEEACCHSDAKNDQTTTRPQITFIKPQKHPKIVRSILTKPKSTNFAKSRILTHKKIGQPRFTSKDEHACPHCFTRFKTKRIFRDHLMAHFEADYYVTLTPDSLRNEGDHMGGSGFYVCRFCQDLFSKAIALMKHEEWFHANDPEPSANSESKQTEEVFHEESMHSEKKVMRRMKQTVGKAGKFLVVRSGKVGKRGRGLVSIGRGYLKENVQGVRIRQDIKNSDGVPCYVKSESLMDQSGPKPVNACALNQSTEQAQKPSLELEQSNNHSEGPNNHQEGANNNKEKDINHQGGSNKHNEEDNTLNNHQEGPNNHHDGSNDPLGLATNHRTDPDWSMETQMGKTKKVTSKNKPTSRKFPCPLCPKSFTNAPALKRHETRHVNHPCPLCKTPCSGVRRLRQHIASHLGEEINGKVIDKESLAELQQKTEDEERKFVCEYCLAAFLDKKYLVIHERIHTGYKPLKCTYCPEAFGNPGSLAFHKKKHLKAIELTGSSDISYLSKGAEEKSK